MSKVKTFRYVPVVFFEIANNILSGENVEEFSLSVPLCHYVVRVSVCSFCHIANNRRA